MWQLNEHILSSYPQLWYCDDHLLQVLSMGANKHPFCSGISVCAVGELTLPLACFLMLWSQSFQGPHRLLRTDTEKVETRMGERERCQVLKISPEFWVQFFLKIIYFYSLNISPFLIFKYMSQKTLSLSFKLSQSFSPSQ